LSLLWFQPAEFKRDIQFYL